jgi:hypothetical protein
MFSSSQVSERMRHLLACYHPLPAQETSTTSDIISTPDGPQASRPSVCANPHSLIVLVAALIREEQLSVLEASPALSPDRKNLLRSHADHDEALKGIQADKKLSSWVIRAGTGWQTAS